jgi:hypothetical protein
VLLNFLKKIVIGDRLRLHGSFRRCGIHCWLLHSMRRGWSLKMNQRVNRSMNFRDSVLLMD